MTEELIKIYVTYEEFHLRIGEEELLDIAGENITGLAEVNVERVEAILKDVHAFVCISVGKTHVSKDIHTVISSCICDIARYRLRVRNHGKSKIYEDVKERYIKALSILKSIKEEISRSEKYAVHYKNC